MEIGYFVKLDDNSRKYFYKYLDALSFFSLSVDESALRNVSLIGITSSLDNCRCHRNLTFYLSKGHTSKQMKSLRLLLEGLKYASANPLIPFDADCTLVTSDNAVNPQLERFHNVYSAHMKAPKANCCNVLSILPWLLHHDRTGHWLRKKIAQDLLKLHQLSLANYFGAPCTSMTDVMSGIESVMFGAYERKLRPPSSQGHTTGFDKFIEKHKIQDIREFIEKLEEIDLGKCKNLFEKICNIDESILTTTFGRLARQGQDEMLNYSDYKSHGLDEIERTDNDCILFMTEQTGLFDVLLAMKKYGKLYIMYSPLVIVHRFLTEAIRSTISGSSSMGCEVSHHFYPAYTPQVVEALIKNIRKCKNNQLDIIVGGSEGVYLVLMKMKNQQPERIKLMTSIKE